MFRHKFTMELRSTLIFIFAVGCTVLALGYAAPAPQPDPATVKEVETPSEVGHPSQTSANADGLTRVVIPEHVHLVDKRSPTFKKYGGYGGGGYGGGGCNVCQGGGGGGYPVGGGHGGGGYSGGSYSQSSSNSQSSSGSWGKK